MSNIIIKYDISNNILYNFLNIHCNYENNYYIIDKLIYKKYCYNDNISGLFKELKQYYRPSKIYYLERETSYNNLLTIIRHICKKNNIEYYSKIKYDKNKYYIIYYIKYIN